MGELDIRLNNIKSSMDKRDYESAVTIASKIKEPRKIKNVDQILMLAELYHRVKEVPDHNEISSELYDLAFQKAPNNKKVVSEAFEFNVRTKNHLNALRYFDALVGLETDEAEICIARHKYYVAIGEVSIEEMIANLEHLKEIRHVDKWEYALARLYKNAGYTQKCIDECDEIFAWFHKGPMVTKALELKMEFQELSKTQKYQYDMRFYNSDSEDESHDVKVSMEDMAAKSEAESSNGAKDDIDDFHVMLGETGDLQDVIKSNLEELYGDDDLGSDGDTAAIGKTGDLYKNILNKNTSEIEKMNEEYENNVLMSKSGYLPDIDDNSLDEIIMSGNKGVGRSTKGASTGYVSNNEEDFGQTRIFAKPAGTRVNPPKHQMEPREEVYHGTIPFDASEVLLEEDTVGETSELIMRSRENRDSAKLDSFKEEFKRNVDLKSTSKSDLDDDLDAEFDLDKFPSEEEIAKSQKLAKVKAVEETQQMVSELAAPEEEQIQKSYTGTYGEIGKYIYQAEDGQLSLSHITAEEIVEKQITGQMNIQEFLNNWESGKAEKEKERQERFKARMFEETGSLISTIDMTVPIMDTELDERLLINSGSDETVEEYRKVINPDIISSKEELKEIIANEAEEEAKAELKEEETRAQIREALGEDAADVTEDAIEAATEEVEEVAEAAIEEEAAEAIAEATVASAAVESAAEAIAEEEAVLAEEIEVENAEIAMDTDAIIQQAIKEDETSDALEDELDNIIAEAVEAEEEAEGEMQEETASKSPIEATNTMGAIWDEVEGKVPVATEESVEETEEESENSEAEAEAEAEDAEAAAEEQASTQGILTEEERKLFAPYLYSKAMKKQIIDSLDKLTLAAYVGNLIITADEGEEACNLARLFALYAKGSDSNFTGNVAILDAEKFNKKDVKIIFNKLKNGALIIDRCNKLASNSINMLIRELNQEELGIIAVLVDTKTEMKLLLDKAPILNEFFNCRVDIISKTTKMLVRYGIQYADSKDYVLDSMAELAFNKRIDDLKKGNHNVTIAEVKEIVDEAIKKESRGLFKFTRGKDENGRIILKEKDFN